MDYIVIKNPGSRKHHNMLFGFHDEIKKFEGIYDILSYLKSEAQHNMNQNLNSCPMYMFCGKMAMSSIKRDFNTFQELSTMDTKENGAVVLILKSMPQKIIIFHDPSMDVSAVETPSGYGAPLTSFSMNVFFMANTYRVNPVEMFVEFQNP